MPSDVSSEGWRIDQLIHHATWAIGALAIIAVVWLAIAVIAGARRAEPAAAVPSRVERWLPLGIMLVVLIGVDGYLFVASNRDWGVLGDSDAAEARAGSVRVEISAQQWGWDIRHAGPDGRFATADDPVDFNRLVVPVNAPVVVQMGSSDVVHALHIPNLRIKQDIIPGQLAEIWFEATAVGRFPIACAQFCGVNHYKMNGVLEVVSREVYDAYIAVEAADSLRIAEEQQRALDEEPSLRPPFETWPRFLPASPGRDWGWEWRP
jgi:cytochrome c oxidase subunit II